MMVLSLRNYNLENLKLNDNKDNPILNLFNALKMKDSQKEEITLLFMSFLVESGGEGTYETLRNSLDDFKVNYNIDDDTLNVDNLFTYMSDHNINFVGLDLRDVIDVFLMNFTNTNVLKNAFKTMAMGITEDNYINNIYSHNHCPRIPYDEGLSAIANLMNEFSHLKNMEMVVNLATFVEMYYQTPEGKAFIEKFSSMVSSDTHTMLAFASVMQPDLVVKLNEEDLKNTHDYFNELFKTMNTYALRNMFITTANGDVCYKFEKKSTINGMFISFEDEKLVVSAGYTTDVSNLTEGVSPMEHGILSKLIAESINETLDEKISGDNSISNKHTYWKSLTLPDKNTFVTHAIFNIFCKNNIIKDKESAFNQFLSDETLVERGMALAPLKEVLLQLDSATLMNKKLGTEGKITGEKLKEFFQNTENFEFRMNYTTIAP